MIAMSEPLAWTLLSVLLAGGLLLSAFYSAMETGIYVLNKVRLDLLAESGHRPAKLLRRMLGNMNNVLAVLLTGTALWEYVATFALSTMFVLGGAGGNAEWYTLALGAPLLFIFCESVPKNVAQRRGDNLTYRLSYVLKLSSWAYNVCGLALLVRGFAWVIMKITGTRQPRSVIGREMFSAVMAEGQASGVLTHMQSIMADRIVHIAEVRLRDVMIPMAKVAKAPPGLGREEVLHLLRTTSYSRLPVAGADGRVLGVLDLYDVLLGDDGEVEGKMVPPLVLSELMPVTDALYEMQRKRSVMAIVASAAGKHVGIVTVKDIVEEIVGELEAW